MNMGNGVIIWNQPQTMHYSEEIPQTHHVCASSLIPKKREIHGNPWRNPRVGPKQKALGAPRSHLQPSAWEDLEDVRYRWHVPPSRSGMGFHGVSAPAVSSGLVVFVLKHMGKKRENISTDLVGIRNCSVLLSPTCSISANHLSPDSDHRFYNNAMLLELSLEAF